MVRKFTQVQEVMCKEVDEPQGRFDRRHRDIPYTYCSVDGIDVEVDEVEFNRPTFTSYKEGKSVTQYVGADEGRCTLSNDLDTGEKRLVCDNTELPRSE